MNEIKRIKKGNFSLIHSWYYDELGMKRNCFEIFDEEKRIHHQFLGMMRIKNQKLDEPLGDDISPYTDKQYEEMFESEIKMF